MAGAPRSPKPTTPVPFGAALRAVRLSVGVSQKDLARRVGMEPANLWKYEAGGHQPTWPLVCELADALGVGVEAFRTLPPPAPRLCENPRCKKPFAGHHKKQFCSRACQPCRQAKSGNRR